MRYRIEVLTKGDVAVRDERGEVVWERQTGESNGDPESLCDGLLAALSWTVRHHSGALTVSVPEKSLAVGLAAKPAASIFHSTRLASMLDEARTLMTWFETTDVALPSPMHGSSSSV